MTKPFEKKPIIIEAIQNLKNYKAKLDKTLSDATYGDLEISDEEYFCTCNSIHDVSVAIVKLEIKQRRAMA